MRPFISNSYLFLPEKVIGGFAAGYRGRAGVRSEIVVLVTGIYR